MQNLKPQILISQPFICKKRMGWPGTHCLIKFPHYICVHSNFHIQIISNACREKIENPRCGCNFGKPEMSRNSSYFSEHPRGPRIFLVFFMTSLCRWLQNETIKIWNFKYFFSCSLTLRAESFCLVFGVFRKIFEFFS